MTKEESLNRWWTEYMGECWHKLDKTLKCKKCGGEFLFTPYPYKNYLSPSMFLTCWNRAKEDEDWIKFGDKYGFVETATPDPDSSPIVLLDERFIDSPAFQEAWARFKGWKEKK